MKRLFALLSILFLVGCTITKRHFGSGYHVEWKKSVAKTEHEADQLNLKDSRQELAMASDEKDELPEVVIPTDSMKTNQTAPSENLDPSIKDQITFSETQSELENYPTIESERILEDDNLPVDEVKKRTEPLTIVSLLLLFGIGISAILISIYSDFLYLGAGIFLAGVAIVIFILSLISLIRTYRYPERYKNKWLTKLVFFLTIFSLVAAGICLMAGIAVKNMGQIM